MNKKQLLLLLPIVSFIWFFMTILLGGLAYDNYSHMSQFISELGATGAPNGTLVNYLGFIPTQLFLLTFIFICVSVIPKTKTNMTGLFFIGIYAFALGIAAVFPCDFECRPTVPSMSHLIHIFSAMPGYLCGIIGIFFISSKSKSWTNSNILMRVGYILGICALGSFLLLDSNFKMVGAIQRLLELSIYMWLILFGFYLRRYEAT